MGIELIIGIGLVLLILCFIFAYMQFKVKSDRVSKYSGIAFVVCGVAFKFYTTAVICYVIWHFASKYW